MFQLLKSLRRPPLKQATSHRTSRGFTRRLGVELMESRWMLSGTSLDFTPSELQPVRFDTQFAAYVGQPTQNVSPGNVADGGYVEVNGVTPGRGTIGVSNSDYDSVGSTVVSGFYQNNNNSITETLGAADAGLLFNSSQTISNNLQPLIISPPQIGKLKSVATFNLESVTGATAAVEQGGLIALQQVLTIGHSGSESSESATKPVGTLASLESSSPNRLASTAASNQALSGEWARAMVFETAGGEPSFAARPGGHSGNTEQPANQRSGNSTSSGATSHAAPSSAERVVSSTVNVHNDANGAVTSSNAHASMSGAKFMLASWSGNGTTTSQPGEIEHAANLGATSIGAAVNEAGVDQDAPDMAPLADGAYVKAFEQFAGRKSAALQTVESDVSSRDSFGIASILMVLALERIATRNSRRPASDAAATAIRRPRRLREPFDLPEMG